MFRPSALAVFEIDRQFVLGRRLHRKVGRLLALKDAIDVACGSRYGSIVLPP